jgi:tyrosyl-tRNA synthetase
MADSGLPVPSGGVTGTSATVGVPATTELPLRTKEGTLTPEERLALINENLAEVLNPEILEDIIKDGRNPKIYWGKWCSAAL